jgi:FkbM family methyltransferase
MKSHLQVLRQVWDAPGNRGHRAAAVLRAFRWFMRCRTGNPEPVNHPVFAGRWIFPCYTDSIIAKHVMYRTEWYDWDLMHFMQSYLRATDSYLDVGANIGLHTLMAARMIREGSITVVEPNPANLLRLKHCLKLNRLENEVQVLPIAASDHRGTMRLVGDDVFSRVDDGAAGVEVRVERLDDLLPMETIHFAKLDVEGAEWQVLSGLERHIEKEMLPVIALELIGHAKVYGLEEEDMLAWLRDRGYRMANYRHDGHAVDFIGPFFGDIFAIHESAQPFLRERLGL